MKQLLSLVLLALGLAQSSAQNLNIALRGTMSFPNQTIANVCGYAAGGHEYALLGGSKALIIVDVTDPDVPQQVVQIPGPNNLWKEIKTYKHYAYVTSEGGQGVQIVDLSGLPGSTLNYHHYLGDGEIEGQLNTIHALHIDTTKGYLYAYGTNLFSGGAVVLDLNADPYNPTFAGKYDEFGYVHDGWVDNDTLYAAHIGAGFITVADMSDKSAPVALGLQFTPSGASHNTWMSKDRRVIYTTDEIDGSYLAAYDITDPTDIRLLDKVRSNPGSNSIGHNTHILENHAVTSWYSDGVTLVDVTEPDNLVQVGNYDIAPTLSGGGFIGCWGVYPFLPSGNIVAATIPTTASAGGAELFMLTPTYKRACYLSGLVTDASNGNPVAGATIAIQNGDIGEPAISGLDGSYKTGQATAGTFNVAVSKPGFLPATVSITLNEGLTAELNVALQPAPSVAVTGLVQENGTNLPVEGAIVSLVSDDGLSFQAETDASGQFTLPAVFVGQYDMVAGAWGHGYAVKNNQNLTTSQSFTFKVNRGYTDDFALDYGWEVSGTSTEGVWERGAPLGVNPGILLVPSADIGGDVGNQCYTTGNSSPNVDVDDVESGTAILRSPVMDLSTYNSPIFRGLLFFTSITFEEESLDSIKIFVENGNEEVLLYHLPGFTFSWQILNKPLASLIPLTSTMRIRIECLDNPDYPGIDSYEATFEGFKILEGAPSTSTDEVLAGSSLRVRPNPFHSQAIVEYDTPAGGDYQLCVYDLLGRRVEMQTANGTGGYLSVGQLLRAGVYFARLEHDGRAGEMVKLVKAE